jgi:hypothetical protein
MRSAFTRDEITLCTYGARYDVDDIGGIEAIHRLEARSEASIHMKMQNIAAILDEEAIPRESDVSPLSGLPHGQSGRRTHWEWVQPLTRLSKAELLETCLGIVAANSQQT